MKINLETKYRVGQVVWVIDGDELWKGTVVAICWYGKNIWGYEVYFDGGGYEKWDEEDIYRTRKDAKAELDRQIKERDDRAFELLMDLIIEEESNNG